VSDHKEGETSIAHVKDSVESLKKIHLLTGIMHTMGMTRKIVSRVNMTSIWMQIHELHR
jgi:hypothetical protein